MEDGLVRRRGAHTCGCRRGAHARGLASCHRASMAAGESSFLLFSSYFIHSFIQNGLLFVKVNAPAAHPR